MTPVVEKLTPAAIDYIRLAGPLILHAGAGISMGPPANAPSPEDVVRASYSKLVEVSELLIRSDMPKSVEQVLTKLPERVLPESLYSAVAEVYDRDIHPHIWAHLDVAATVFNSGHRLYCQLAARGDGSLITTTNYDTFFERAAETLGYSHEVTGVEGLAADPPPAAGVVRVVKLHGDASRPDSIVSKLPDLARMASALADYKGRVGPRTIVVIGYSGRDLDVFPWIVQQKRFDTIYWINRTFKENHRALTVPDSMACHLLEGLIEDVLPTEIAVSDPVGSHPESLAKACEDEAREAIDLLGASRSAEASWVVARVLADRGLHRQASWIGNAVGVTEMPQMAPLISHSLASQDRYLDAAEVPIPHGDWVNAATTGLMVAFAKLVYDAKFFRLPGEATRHIRLWYQIVPAARYLLRLAPYIHPGFMALRRARSAPLNTTIADYRLACEWIESLIRLYALVQYFLPRPIAGKVLSYIDRVCHEAGYVRGALNIEKYEIRLHRGVVGDLSPRFRMLEDLTGAALELRDQARQRLRTESGTYDRDGFDHITRRAVQFAIQSGSALTLVECELLRREAHFAPVATHKQIDFALDTIQIRNLDDSRRSILRQYLRGVP